MRLAAMISVLFLLLPFASATGQTEDEDSGRPNSLAAGMSAVQFVIKAEPYYGFGSGVEFAVKRHHSDGGALRFGIGLRWDQYDRTEEGIRSRPPSGDAAYTNRVEDEFWSVGGDLLWIGYPLRGGLVNLYWGLGPTGGYAKSKFRGERSVEDPDAAQILDVRALEVWTIGGKALVGLEWFVVERVGLYMEYRARVAYSSESGEDYSGFDDNTVDGTVDGSRWDLDSNAVLVGLSAYF